MNAKHVSSPKRFFRKLWNFQVTVTLTLRHLYIQLATRRESRLVAGPWQRASVSIHLHFTGGFMLDTVPLRKSFPQELRLYPGINFYQCPYFFHLLSTLYNLTNLQHR